MDPKTLWLIYKYYRVNFGTRENLLETRVKGGNGTYSIVTHVVSQVICSQPKGKFLKRFGKYFAF